MGRRDESTALGGCCSCPRSFIARARTSPRINLCVHHSFMAHAHSDPPPRINLYVHHSFMAHACTHARPHTHTPPQNKPVCPSFLYGTRAHTHTQNKPVCPSVHISNSVKTPAVLEVFKTNAGEPRPRRRVYSVRRESERQGAGADRYALLSSVAGRLPRTGTPLCREMARRSRTDLTVH